MMYHLIVALILVKFVSSLVLNDAPLCDITLSSASSVYPVGTNYGPSPATSTEPLDVFEGEIVIFRGVNQGGTTTVFKYLILCDIDIAITGLYMASAAHNTDTLYITDTSNNVLWSYGLSGGNSYREWYFNDITNINGSAFYITETNSDTTWRWRQNITIYANVNTKQPTKTPSTLPTNNPTSPTLIPTTQPSNFPSTIPSIIPSNIPSNIPSDTPSNYPSNIPTDNPSSEPSNQPTTNPTELPTKGPTSLPSDSPTILPTNSPTNQPTEPPSDIPTDEPTLEPTIKPTTEPIELDNGNGNGNGSGSSKTNSGNKETNGLSEASIIIIFCVSLLFIICLVMVYFISKHNNKKLMIAKELELHRLQSLKSVSLMSQTSVPIMSNGITGHTGHTGANSLQLTLPPVPSIGTNVLLGTDTLMIGNNKNNNQNKRGEIGEDIEDVGNIVDVRKDNVHVIKKNNNQKLNLGDDENEGDAEQNISGKELELVDGLLGTDEVVNGPNEKQYDKWTQKEVLEWVKIDLKNNGIDEDRVKSFCNEFDKKYITGAMLVKFQKNPLMIDELMKQFTEENRIFGIWMVSKQ